MSHYWPNRISKHREAINYFNDLILDLHLQIDGKEPHKPIDLDRIKEADKHFDDISQCTEPMIYR